MPPNRFESEVESFLEGSHGDRTHIKRADHPRLHHYAGHYSVIEGDYQGNWDQERAVATTPPRTQSEATKAVPKLGRDD